MLQPKDRVMPFILSKTSPGATLACRYLLKYMQIVHTWALTPCANGACGGHTYHATAPGSPTDASRVWAWGSSEAGEPPPPKNPQKTPHGEETIRQADSSRCSNRAPLLLAIITRIYYLCARAP